MSKKKTYNDDDGRVIADMNIEGMPWTDGSHINRMTIIPKFKKRKLPDLPIDENDKTVSKPEKIDLSRKETLGIILNSVLAGLLVASVFAIAFGLFILFCTKFWFK